jgi:integrase
MTDLKAGSYEERLKDGELLLYSRNRIFHARIYKGAGVRRYLYRSMKTKDLHIARERAEEFFHEIRIRKRDNLPLDNKRFKDVIAEYLKLRRAQFERGTYKHANKVNQQQTSEENLRQMVRVSKFLVAYCGNMPVEKVTNAVLADYVPWRRDFYRRMPEHKRPRNHRLDPADKTLEWETTFSLTVLKWAHERGYRGQKPLPKFRHKASRAKTRPAFTADEYRRLYRQMQHWITKADNEEWRYTRELLRDYVLILANSGIRVGEANKLREQDLIKFTDDVGRENYRFSVDGKTGRREVVMRTNALPYIQRTLERNARWRSHWAEKGPSKANRRRKAERQDWLFPMADGSQIISLADQFDKVLNQIAMKQNADGENLSLYSLRHFYAVQMLRRGKANIYDIAKNMGTSVEMIERYYGRSATAATVAVRLG